MQPSRLSLVLAACAVLLGGPAVAAENNPHALAKNDGGLNFVPVAVPVIVGGRVRNYVFVTLRMIPANAAALSALQAKEPFFRDALVRSSHHTPFTLANDYNRVDDGRIAAAMMAAGDRILGRGQVKAVVIAQQQPKNIVASPRPPAAPRR
jgi:hypothetical protein